MYIERGPIFKFEHIILPKVLDWKNIYLRNQLR